MKENSEEYEYIEEKIYNIKDSMTIKPDKCSCGATPEIRTHHIREYYGDRSHVDIEEYSVDCICWKGSGRFRGIDGRYEAICTWNKADPKYQIKKRRVSKSKGNKFLTAEEYSKDVLPELKEIISHL